MRVTLPPSPVCVTFGNYIIFEFLNESNWGTNDRQLDSATSQFKEYYWKPLYAPNWFLIKANKIARVISSGPSKKDFRVDSFRMWYHAPLPTNGKAKNYCAKRKPIQGTTGNLLGCALCVRTHERNMLHASTLRAIWNACAPFRRSECNGKCLVFTGIGPSCVRSHITQLEMLLWQSYTRRAAPICSYFVFTLYRAQRLRSLARSPRIS